MMRFLDSWNFQSWVEHNSSRNVSVIHLKDIENVTLHNVSITTHPAIARVYIHNSILPTQLFRKNSAVQVTLPLCFLEDSHVTGIIRSLDHFRLPAASETDPGNLAAYPGGPL
jgi:hypothetical protein